MVRKMSTQKNNKKYVTKKSWHLPKWSQIGDPGVGQSSAKLWLVRDFLHPGREMGQESSQGPQRLAQGVEKVPKRLPKGSKKIRKRHPKGFHQGSKCNKQVFRDFYRQFNKQCYCQCNRHWYPLAFGLPATVPDNVCRGLRLPIAVAIALPIALLIELPIEFPMHLLIAFGCLVVALWISFSCLFVTFWKPFGTFWTPWATLFSPRGDSWPISGPGCKKLRKSYNLVAIWLPTGSPIWINFINSVEFLTTMVCCFFGCPFFLQFAVPGTIWHPICDVFLGTWDPWK